MKNRVIFFSLTLFILQISFSTLFAQNTSLVKGMKLKTIQKVKVRSAPPEQTMMFFVKSPGEPTGSLDKGEEVKIESIKTVSSPLTKDVWIKVLSKSSSGEQISGWVYYGSEKEAANFKALNGE